MKRMSHCSPSAGVAAAGGSAATEAAAGDKTTAFYDLESVIAMATRSGPHL